MIKFTIETLFKDTILKMYSDLRIFNTVTKLDQHNCVDTRIIKFGMGRQTGHTQTAADLCNHFVKQGFNVILVSDSKQRLTETIRGNSLLHALHNMNSIVGYNLNAGTGAMSLARHTTNKTVVICDAILPKHMDALYSELAYAHNRTPNENYYFILQ